MTQEVERAMALHREGRLDQADAAYRGILEEAPDNPDALHYLGVLAHQKGDSDRAVALIGKALEHSPDNPAAINNLGNVHKESGRMEEAERWYRKAIELDETDADAWNNLGVVLKLQGRHLEAIEAGLRSVNFRPGFAHAWLNLGNTLKKAGQLEEALATYHRAIRLEPGLAAAHHGLSQVIHRLDREGRTSPATLEERKRVYRTWLENEPDNPVGRFMLAACSGDSSWPRAPDRYIRSLFDGFAGSFDESVARLEYRVPELVKARLESLFPTPKNDLRVLDAGCGTGLCGPVLKPYSDSLIGVDLSGGMLERAKRLGVYDDLVEAELTAYLEGLSERFDVIVSADTLCYFGALDGVVTATARALAPGGQFIFSVEELVEPGDTGFKLLPFGRYCHALGHVEACLAECGLSLTGVQHETLRTESGEPVAGLIVSAQLPRPRQPQ